MCDDEDVAFLRFIIALKSDSVRLPATQVAD